MYRTEAGFSKALCNLLSREGIFHQRIETGSTGRGVPDLYVLYKGAETWIELKNDWRQHLNQTYFNFKFRKGQKAWHLNYWNHGIKPVTTIMAVANGFVFYEVKNARTPVSAVPGHLTRRYTDLKDIISFIKD